MAKNDMEVIMYKILRYLYECMKLGVEPELEQFAWNSKLFDIPQSYWCKIENTCAIEYGIPVIEDYTAE